MGLVLEEENVFFSGDCILGQTRPVFEDMDLYEKSLKKISNVRPKVKRIFPGHGPVVEDPQWKIQDYLMSIQRRQNLILDALSKAQGRGLNTIQIVDQIYLDITPMLKFGAIMSVENHLKKLLKDRKVRSRGDNWSLPPTPPPIDEVDDFYTRGSMPKYLY